MEAINFEEELYKAFGQVKDFSLGMRIAKCFYKMGANAQKLKDEKDIGDQLSVAYQNGFENGRDNMKQEMLKDAFLFNRRHNTACVLASECLRDHGWFAREHDFNDMWSFISGIDKRELFSPKFQYNDKVKLIIIKEK